MNLEDFLNEIEGAIQGDRPLLSTKQQPSQHTHKNASDMERLRDHNLCSKGGSSGTAKHGTRSTSVKETSIRSPKHENNDLDDLLELVSGDSKLSTASTSTSKSMIKSKNIHTTATSLQVNQSAAPKKRCLIVQIGGANCRRGQGLGHGMTVCDHLRCMSCDFSVLQFPQKKWKPDVEYMFFRENMPNEAILSRALLDEADFTAYACQCAWLSSDTIQGPNDLARRSIKWLCSGH